MNIQELDITKIETESNELITKAENTVIKTNEQYINATDFLKIVKGLQNEVKDTFDPIVQKAHAAHKEAVAQKDKYLKPLIQAEGLVKNRISGYLADQERIRLEQERKLQEEAEKKRQEALKKAEIARENGNENKAEKYEEKAATIVAPTLAPTVSKVNGISTRENWYAEVVDVALLPKEYMVPDLPKLNKLAKAMKDSMKVPGVIFKCETIINSSSK